MTVGILMLISVIALVVIFAIGWVVTGDAGGGRSRRAAKPRGHHRSAARGRPFRLCGVRKEVAGGSIATTTEAIARGHGPTTTLIHRIVLRAETPWVEVASDGE